MPRELPSGEYEIRRHDGPSQHHMLRALELLHDDSTPRLLKFKGSFDPAVNDISDGFSHEFNLHVAGLFRWGQSDVEVDSWLILGMLFPSEECDQLRTNSGLRLVTGFYQTSSRTGHLYVYPTETEVTLGFSWRYVSGGHIDPLLYWEKPITELVHPPEFFALRRTPGSKWNCVSKERYLHIEQESAQLGPFPNGQPEMSGFDHSRVLDKVGYAGQVFVSEIDLIRFAQREGFNKINLPDPVGLLLCPRGFWRFVESDEYVRYQHEESGWTEVPVPVSFNGDNGRSKGRVFYDQAELDAFVEANKHSIRRSA